MLIVFDSATNLDETARRVSDRVTLRTYSEALQDLDDHALQFVLQELLTFDVLIFAAFNASRMQNLKLDTTVHTIGPQGDFTPSSSSPEQAADEIHGWLIEQNVLPDEDDGDSGDSVEDRLRGLGYI